MLGNIAGYTSGKGISKETGKGLKPVGEIAGLPEVSDTGGVLGGIWDTEGDITSGLLGGVPNDATLEVELAGGVARSLRA